MSRLPLTPHPVTADVPLQSISADIARTGAVLTLRFDVRGELANIRVPSFTGIRPADRLWEHTCFEAFVRTSDSPQYFEFNFAPGGAYAIYGFDDYRAGMRSVELTPTIDSIVNARELQLVATVDLGRVDQSLVSAPLQIAASAVIEDSDGVRSYWALKHPADKPDFHHRDAFVHTLEPAP